MFSQLDVRLAAPSERVPLARMLELYQYELSPYWEQDLDASGQYGYTLDRYWQAEGHYPYVASANGHYVGFALVDDQVKIAGGDFWMDQFFVLKNYRWHGLGDKLARHVFGRHRGRWQVGQMRENVPARAFWRRTIGRVTSGTFEEKDVKAGAWHGYVQSFTSK